MLAGRTSSWANHSDHSIDAFSMDGNGATHYLYTMPPHTDSNWVGSLNDHKTDVIRLRCPGPPPIPACADNPGANICIGQGTDDATCPRRFDCLYMDKDHNKLMPNLIWRSDSADGAKACEGGGRRYDLKRSTIQAADGRADSFAGKTSSWMNRSNHYIDASRVDRKGVEHFIFTMPPHSQDDWVGLVNNDKADRLWVRC